MIILYINKKYGNITLKKHRKGEDIMKTLRLTKLIAITLVLVSVVAINPTEAYAAQRTGSVTSNILNNSSVTPESDFTFDGSTGTITKYNGSDAVVAIPSVINGVPVKIIGVSAFAKHTNLTSVTIPYGVTTIGNSAFYFTGVTNLIIPNSVTTIGIGAFASSGITSITLSNSLTSIGSDAFWNCEKLMSIQIPYGVTTLKNSTFVQCPNLTSVTIPNSVTTIETTTFYSCQNLKSIKIPNSVTTIKSGAFLECNNAIFYVNSSTVKQLLISSGVNQTNIRLV